MFKSDIEGYFINHFDLSKAQDLPIEPTQPPVPTWTDLVLRLSKSPVISIAKIRGRPRGGGNDFALACDLRYASLEKALFGQPEVGSGILPGGGGTERLARLWGETMHWRSAAARALNRTWRTERRPAPSSTERDKS